MFLWNFQLYSRRKRFIPSFSKNDFLEYTIPRGPSQNKQIPRLIRFGATRGTKCRPTVFLSLHHVQVKKEAKRTVPLLHLFVARKNLVISFIYAVLLRYCWLYNKNKLLCYPLTISRMENYTIFLQPSFFPINMKLILIFLPLQYHSN